MTNCEISFHTYRNESPRTDGHRCCWKQKNVFVFRCFQINRVKRWPGDGLGELFNWLNCKLGKHFDYHYGRLWSSTNYDGDEKFIQNFCLNNLERTLVIYSTSNLHSKSSFYFPVKILGKKLVHIQMSDKNYCPEIHLKIRLNLLS